MNIDQSLRRETIKPGSKEGFTLVEIMIVIAVIGIIAAIAIPNFITWLANNRLRDAAQDLLSDMQYTKFESIKRNRNVVVSFTPVVCAPTVPTPGGSYSIFVDFGSGVTLNNNNNTWEAGEPVLKQVAMGQGMALCNAPMFAGNTTGFTPNGRPIGLAGGAVTLQNNNGRTHTLTLGVAGSITLN